MAGDDLCRALLRGEPTASRALKEVASIFSEQVPIEAREQIVYQVFGSPNQDNLDPPKLLHATTVLYPGQVGNEPFMTRGHFHRNPDRGEICLTLGGHGLFLLTDRTGSLAKEKMSPGSVHDIDGSWAHRVVNTGAEPLTFFVTWMSDCGHDYESIRDLPFERIFL